MSALAPNRDEAGEYVRTPPWTLVSAAVAPIALIGGWTIAADRQRDGYNAISQTISALAAHGAHDRAVMTTGLAALGGCYLITAAGLRPARRAGRIALALGGAATLAVAAFPQPRGGSSGAHTTSAAIAFFALTAWPALAARRGAGSALAPRTSYAASSILLGLLVWFGAALDGDHVGLAERFLAGAQSLWPLAVVLATLLAPPIE